ncbi:hypothetical protein F5884DRAFT_825062 [Xylogone sp. PMI_703]|nr:hypothetical protein F5884DRAFT_825062 [Xylogone sp. PMI_703]
MAEPTTDVAAPPVITFKKRGAKAKGNIKKRAATPPSDSSEYSSSEDESGHKIKRRKKNTGAVTASSTSNKPSDKDFSATVFEADRSGNIASTNDATKQSNWYDEESKDALSSKNLLGTTRSLSKDAQKPDGTYKGLANQTSFVQKNPDSLRSVGPVKAAPTNVRMTTYTDYAPDTCKDYKTTGFCGFGDNCKYLHDRSDYKQGWQLDREWENVTKGKKVAGKVVASANRSGGAEADENDEEQDAMLENIPFACIICREGYKNPIVTRCGHYFCESCALKRYRKDPSCAACGAGTNGVFNTAKKLNKLLERKRERAEKRRREAIEAGEEVSEEEEED